MTRIGGRLLLVSCVVSGCAPPPTPPPVPTLFARHVGEADKDYDEKLFLSYRKDGLLAAPVTLGKETQLSLTPPLPSRLTFRVQVPAEGSLEFSIGVSTLGEKTFSDPVRFALHVDEKVLFDHTVRRAQPNVWLEQSVDLSEWAGKTVRLGFETAVHGTSPGGTGSSFLPAWGNPVLGGSTTQTEGDNLVLISVDCLRADHVSAYGYKRKTTPNIDRFAADGVVFRNAASVSSWTLPTHMSIMTGLMPSLHGASRAYKLSSSVPYLPEILAQNGYQTLGVASGGYVSQAWGFERGFDVYRMLTDRRAREVVDAAIQLAVASRASRTGRKFLFVHLFDAHWPYLPPSEFLDRFAQRPPDISDIMPKVIRREPPTGPEEIQHFVNLYDGEIAYLDQELGRLFSGLKDVGLYDRSLIILTADHGESFYEHGVWQHSESLFEEVTHIPLIVKWPRSSPVGEVESLVSQLNIFPTMLEQAGLVPPYHYVPLGRFLGESPAPPVNAMSEITWDAKEGQGAAMRIAVRNGRLKYVLTLAGEPEDELFVSDVVKEELYDLSQDPGERKNLLPGASDIGALRRDARELLEKARALQANRGGQEVILDEELTEHLKALGYVN